MGLSHRERIQACIMGDPALDRPPVALWRHFPIEDQSSTSLADATIRFQEAFDFDIVKVSPASSFCLKDWGAEDRWEGNIEGTRRYQNTVIKTPEDWEKLKVLDPHQSPHFLEQLTCLKLLKNYFHSDTPIVQTIFSPLAQAKNLIGASSLRHHLREHNEFLIRGLETIAKTTVLFMESCLEIGVDGFFYSIQHARRGELSEKEYHRFGLPYDLSALSHVKGSWCNILHLHGNDIYFDLVKDFSDHFQIVNWHDKETDPSLKSAQDEYGVSVCGGIGLKNVYLLDPDELSAEVNKAMLSTQGKRHIIGTGCVTPIITPHSNLISIRRSVERFP
jgi:uroporphyrinogen decarboxylase